MAYTITYSDPSKAPISLAALSTNTTTDLTFVGRGVPNFGEVHQNNFLHLLENFASPIANAPTKPVEGQLWYNTDYQSLMIRTDRGGVTGPAWEEVVDESLKYLAFLM